MSKPPSPSVDQGILSQQKTRTLLRPPACHPRPTGQRSETGSFIPLPQGLGGSDELPYVNSAVHRQHFQNPVRLMSSGTVHSGSEGEKQVPFNSCFRVGPICFSRKKAGYPCGGLNVWCPVVGVWGRFRCCGLAGGSVSLNSGSFR